VGTITTEAIYTAHDILVSEWWLATPLQEVTHE